MLQKQHSSILETLPSYRTCEVSLMQKSYAFMTSRLVYCNTLLGGCPASSINKLHIVQNAAARVLTRSRKYDHITPILQSLHWLPIKFRISYKILLLAYLHISARSKNNQKTNCKYLFNTVSRLRMKQASGSRQFLTATVMRGPEGFI